MKVLASIIVGLLLLSATGDKKHKDRIYWNEKRGLTRKDFQATPERKSPRAAISSLGISNQSKKRKDGSVKLTIRSFFDPNKSWIKIEYRTDYTLSHEQSHWNITEIYARKIRKAVRESRITSRSLSTEFASIYDKFYQLYQEEQTKYDNDTKHALDKEQQASWNKKITEELKALDAYKEPVIIIPYM